MLFDNAQHIESDAQISYNNIHFKANGSVELDLDFEVLFGKTFIAEIGPCPE